MANVTTEPTAPQQKRRRRLSFGSIATVMNWEGVKDLVYYVTGGRFAFLPVTARWWVVVPKSKEQNALEALREQSRQFPWAYRRIKRSSSLAEALTALGLEPYIWNERMDPVESTVLRYLSGWTNPRQPEFGAIVIPYLRGDLVVRSPEVGSIVLGRGSWSQRSLKRMPAVDELVLNAMAAYVHPGSVAHSPDGHIRYMYDRGRLVSQPTDPLKGQTLS
jgi:hypothetical protein